MNPEYIAKQVRYYNQSISPSARADALWRIASNADILEPMPDGPISEEQANQVLAWLAGQGFQVVQDLFSVPTVSPSSRGYLHPTEGWQTSGM